jgi:hypothetical protein
VALEADPGRPRSGYQQSAFTGDLPNHLGQPVMCGTSIQPDSGVGVISQIALTGQPLFAGEGPLSPDQKIRRGYNRLRLTLVHTDVARCAQRFESVIRLD